jgi:DNA-binding CsgD family transcriptional regulator
VAGYQGGKTTKELAVEFSINRLTVSAHLRRAKVPTRRKGLDQERAVEVAVLYEAGWSSGQLATRFGVSADTVLKALRREGVRIRPPRGRPASKAASAWGPTPSRALWS